MQFCVEESTGNMKPWGRITPHCLSRVSSHHFRMADDRKSISAFLGPNPGQPIVHLTKSAIWRLPSGWIGWLTTAQGPLTLSTPNQNTSYKDEHAPQPDLQSG
jgi:hypothetical protein